MALLRSQVEVADHVLSQLGLNERDDSKDRLRVVARSLEGILSSLHESGWPVARPDRHIMDAVRDAAEQGALKAHHVRSVVQDHWEMYSFCHGRSEQRVRALRVAASMAMAGN